MSQIFFLREGRGGKKKIVKQGFSPVIKKDVMMTYRGGCFAHGFHFWFMSFNTSCAMVAPMKRIVSTF